MSDPILDAFRAEQARAARALAAESDLFDITPLDGPPPSRYLAEFRCNGLVRRGGAVHEADRWQVLLCIPDDYLRREHPDPAAIIALLAPSDAFHPNVRAPFVCPGHLARGTRLVDLAHQIHEILSGQRVNPREDDCLQRDACPWVRANRHRYPVDPRPLRWRAAARGAGRVA